MEDVAANNQIDNNHMTEPRALGVNSDSNQGRTDLSSPDPTSCRGADQQPLVPEAVVSTELSAQESGDVDSDATESADSENDMDLPPEGWELRRSSSSSSIHSGEDMDSDTLERRRFMKAYVLKVFHGKEDFDHEEKARFGELCSGVNGKGREWFAKYVSAQRCHSKCVSEATFYRLVQSFAVVLFECYQMDDYSPAKNLMTMCFTYYYYGKSQPSPSELLDRGATPAGLDSYLNKANSWLTVKKGAAERLLKTTSKTDVKGFFGGLESKLRSSMAPKAGDADCPAGKKPSAAVSETPQERTAEKIYLYTHLKQQPIWHTLRFWNAAFFDAVHCERTKRSPPTKEKWCHMTQEERDDSSKIDENIAFGQLGTFTHNMLAFGLSRKLCNDFLKKQAVIGNLNEGEEPTKVIGLAITFQAFTSDILLPFLKQATAAEQYKLLMDHIEKMALG